MIILILKIIGIILLSIILIIAAFLLIPWHIKAVGDFEKKDYSLKASVSSGLYFLKVKYNLKEKDSLKIYIFWGLIRIFNKKQNADVVNENIKQFNGESADSGLKPNINNENVNNANVNNANDKNSNSENTDYNKNETVNNETVNDELIKIQISGRRKKEKKDSESRTGIFDKIKSFVTEINDESNKKALKYVISSIKGLLRNLHIRLKGTKINFSTGEPDWTGIATGIISLFPLSYMDGVKITPDFESEEAYLDGHLRLRGSIILLWVIITAFKLFMNKDCRKVFNRIGG